MSLRPVTLLQSNTLARRRVVWVLTLLLVIISISIIALTKTKTTLLTSPAAIPESNIVSLPPFPVGIDRKNKVITEQPDVENYLYNFVASNHTKPTLEDSWYDRALARLTELDWYQNLATPATRIIVIESGQRHEEITHNIARILKWNNADKETFTNRLLEEVPAVKDGKLYPGRYIVDSSASPDAVAVAIAERFNAEVRTRYTDAVASRVPLIDTLIIASLIEREAYDFDDMRYISGVIWNRLFTDMKLQIDATLQYAKVSQNASVNGRWWPVPTPADKFIKSPFNTYQNRGLPPAPISNPSIDAIVAALNPRQTDCLFYFHTDDGTFYCNKTYEAHVAGLKEHFGRGK